MSQIITSGGGGGVSVPNIKFSAYLNAIALNVTGDATDYTVPFNVELYDDGAGYDNTTGIFTAPVTGKYVLTSHIWALALTLVHSAALLEVVTTNDTFRVDGYFSTSFAGDRMFGGTIVTDLAVGETAYININVSGSTKVIDIYGDATSNHLSYFSGALLA